MSARSNGRLSSSQATSLSVVMYLTVAEQVIGGVRPSPDRAGCTCAERFCFFQVIQILLRWLEQGRQKAQEASFNERPCVSRPQYSQTSVASTGRLKLGQAVRRRNRKVKVKQ